MGYRRALWRTAAYCVVRVRRKREERSYASRYLAGPGGRRIVRNPLATSDSISTGVSSYGSVTTKKPKSATKGKTPNRRAPEPKTCATKDCFKPPASSRWEGANRIEADGYCVVCQMEKKRLVTQAPGTEGIPEAMPVAAGGSTTAAGLGSTATAAMPMATATPVDNGSHKKWWEQDN